MITITVNCKLFCVNTVTCQSLASLLVHNALRVMSRHVTSSGEQDWMLDAKNRKMRGGHFVVVHIVKYTVAILNVIFTSKSSL